MLTEFNIWNWLCKGSKAKGDVGNLLIRQPIPEVCVFRGCKLDGWYHSNGNGLLLRRNSGVTIEAMLEHFLALAGDEEERVAILRRPSALLAEGGRPGAEPSPWAALLSRGELEELVSRVQAGTAEGEAWSLQSYVSPAEDERVVSVYNCDARGVERTDIFGRRFSSVYSRDKEIVVPSAEITATDRCLNVPPTRRQAIEAKTIGIVRAAARFHGLEIEGLTLEFVFDDNCRPVLHGCWCASLFSADGPHRRRGVNYAPPAGSYGEATNSGSCPANSAAAKAQRCVWSVPRIAQPVRGDPLGADSEIVGEEDGGELSLSPRASSPSLRTGWAGLSLFGAAPCHVLVEAWCGEAFLGEAWLPLPREGITVSERIELPLSRPDVQGTGGSATLGRNAEETRPDKRKAWTTACASAGTVTAHACLREGDDGQIIFSIGPATATDLQIPDSGNSRPRLSFWQQVQDSRLPHKFRPLWESPESAPAAPRCAHWPGLGHMSLGLAAGDSLWASCIDDAVGNVSPSLRSRSPGRSPSPPGRSLLPPSDKRRARSTEFETVVGSPHDLVCGAQLGAHWGMVEADGLMSTQLLAEQVGKRFSVGRTNRSAMVAKLASQLQQYHAVELAWRQHAVSAGSTVAALGEKVEQTEQEIAKVREQIDADRQQHHEQMAAVCREMSARIDEFREAEHEDNLRFQESKLRVAMSQTMLQKAVEQTKGLEGALSVTVDKISNIHTERVIASEATERLEITPRSTPRSAAPGASHASPQHVGFGALTEASEEGGLSDVTAVCAGQQAEGFSSEGAGGAGNHPDEDGPSTPPPRGAERGLSSPAGGSPSGRGMPNQLCPPVISAPGSPWTPGSPRSPHSPYHEARTPLQEEFGKDVDDVGLSSPVELQRLKEHLHYLEDHLADEKRHASRLEEFVQRLARGPSTRIRTGGGWELDSFAKREAMALVRELMEEE